MASLDIDGGLTPKENKFIQLINHEFLFKFKYNDIKPNIIYLDFDGVLTTVETRYKMNIEKVKLLLNFIKSTPNTYIILTTSWRNYDLETTLHNLSFNEEFKPLLPYVIGQTERSNHRNRGLEIDDINKYISHFSAYKIKTNYVILDDDSDMTFNQRFNFIKTHALHGLCVENIADMYGKFNVDKTVFNICFDFDEFDKFHYEFITYNYMIDGEILQGISIPIFDELNGDTKDIRYKLKSHNELIKVFKLFAKYMSDNDEFNFVYDHKFNMGKSQFIEVISENMLFNDSILHYFNLYKQPNLIIKWG